MTIPSAKTTRSGLATAITTGITALQAVYGYYPKDFNGQSPVCTVQRLPVQVNINTALAYQTYDFEVAFWALSDGVAGSGLTAADAEDKLDDLLDSLCSVLIANYNAEFYQPSDQFQMAMESGNVYQMEAHYVRIRTP